ncbi:2-hydroxymuconate tautomerase family protein [Aneurinibacillus sp. Ricciae_BoGa-3]|uniref:tautomerase family protein n=1 Tax=Aneurinibacillus sp. Ricciae_BoGa-3 TaxID=3022697 RepID=UPI0023418750|nr:2-hydroxymuconate tautomerase family protein [Aneurinibacillus sp. Ricciae_BoGa-3]WCK53418.1 2-hydroxymuconate tautomerase family protein [Aneurinibacillus sp. Ricciae_BoGa-3]
MKQGYTNWQGIIEEVADMPVVRIEMLEGRSEEMKGSMIREVTDAMARSLNIEKEEVDILISEIKRNDWAKGGVSWPWKKP